MSDAAGSKRDAAPDPGVERAGRIGRNAALAVYFACLAYMVVVGFWTTIANVFAQPTSNELALASAGSCDEVRASLGRELRTASSRYVADGDRTANQRFLRAFDHRYNGLLARCDDDETRALGMLRHRVEIQLLRFEHENADSFDHFGGGQPTTNSPESPR